VGETVTAVYDLLWREIVRCLLHERRSCGPGARRACEEQALDQAYRFMRKLPEIMRLVDGDIRAGYSGDPAATGPEEVLFCYPGLRAVMIQRIAHQLHGQDVRWLPRMMTEYAHGLTGIDIHPGATIGERFFIDHGTGVVIGETCEIGNDVRLYQGVTLGAWSFRKDESGHLVRGYKRHPTIADGVVVYANASVLGPITIGAGSVVGANVMVTEDVPPDSVVSVEQSKPRVKKK
jgi:serine O-acetyltransferase